MRHRFVAAALATAALALGLAGCASHPVQAPAAPAGSPTAAVRSAPLFEGLGDYHLKITTRSELAQRYFDQGMTLSFGFNHAEAARSFREASRLDPECAMCSWGLALVLGPNINVAMNPNDVPEAWRAIREAQRLAPGASPRERDYIAALATRYAAEPGADRSGLDAAWADALREVMRKYPDDLDAAALFAEAVMDKNPWNYWEADGSPRSFTPELIEVLESVLARDPRHPLALHLYIHATEASPDPRRAEDEADRLTDLVPASGHLVHMPGHTFIRLGRYMDAVMANRRADAADEAYIAGCSLQGVYPLVYHPHNNHFRWVAAAFAGFSAEAIAAAEKVRRQVSGADVMPMHGTQEMAFLQHYGASPLYAWARFGRWEKILADPEPARDLYYARAVRHYARGLAYLRTDRASEARTELAALTAIVDGPEIEGWTIAGFNSFRQVLTVAKLVLTGELEAAAGNHEQAIATLREAAHVEDTLIYQEPPDWYLPVRQILGQVLLDAGRPAEAEQVYREDLVELPGNGWSLFGLARALEAQGRTAEAQATRAQLHAAWKSADFEITSSRL
jgi:tetratricopeptide (TPR) repeat protein